MRILLTTDTVGGVWTFTRELAEGLLAAGHAVALVSFGRMPSGSQGQWTRSAAARFGERFFFFASDAPLEWMPENADAWQRGALAVSVVIDQFEPEILHASQFCFGQMETGLPCLITAHSDVLSWAEACRPEGLEDSPWLREYEHLVTGGLNGADAVTAPTEWMSATLARLYRLDTPPDVIGNGLDLTPSQGRERRLAAITAGRLWDPGKGLALLGQLRTDWPILLAGETRFGDEVPPIPDGVELLGALRTGELHAHFQGCAAYLLTSLYEPFGLTAVEAALCGCAVAARDLPSLREVWGDAARYFADADELRLILTHWRSDPAALAGAQASSRERARMFSRGKMTAGYLHQYDLLQLQYGVGPYAAPDGGNGHG